MERLLDGLIKTVVLRRSGDSEIVGEVILAEQVTEAGVVITRERRIVVEDLPAGGREELRKGFYATEADIKERDYS